MVSRSPGVRYLAACAVLGVLLGGCSRPDRAQHRETTPGVAPASAPPATAPVEEPAVPITHEQLDGMGSGDELVRLKTVKEVAALGPDAVAPLVARLGRSGDPNLRRSCVEALGWIGPGATAAVPALIRALDDEELREPAVWALRKVGPRANAAAPVLASLREGASELLQQQIERTLAEIGPPGSAPVGDGDQEMFASTEQIRSWLGALVERNEMESVLRRAGWAGRKASPSLVAKVEAARDRARDALRRLKSAGRRAAPELANALVAPVLSTMLYDARLNLIQVVVDLGPESKEVISVVGMIAQFGRDYGPREAALRVLDGLAREPALTDVLVPIFVAKQDMKGLRAAGPRAVPALIRALREKKPAQPPGRAPYRGFSVPRVLGELGPPAKDALPALVETLDDLDLFSDTVEAIGRIDLEGGPATVEPRLVRALKGNAAWRDAALESLYRTKHLSPAVQAALHELAVGKPAEGTPNPGDFWLTVVTVFGRLAPGSLPQDLLDRLLARVKSEAETRPERLPAAVLVGDFGARAVPAAPHLLTLLKPKPPAPPPPEPANTSASTRRWRSFTPPPIRGQRERELQERTITPATADYEVRRYVAASLGKIGSPTIPTLIDELRKPGDRSYREYLVHAIGSAGRLDGAAVSALVPLISDPEIGMPVAFLVVPHAQGPDQEALKTGLIAALADPERIIGAALVLQRLDPEVASARAVPALLGAIKPFVGPLKPYSIDEGMSVRDRVVLQLIAQLTRPDDLSILPSLLAVVRDPYQPARPAAFGAIATIGEKALPALLDAFDHAPPDDWVTIGQVIAQVAGLRTGDPDAPKRAERADDAVAHLLLALARGDLRQRAALLSLLVELSLSAADWERLTPLALEVLARGARDERSIAVAFFESRGAKALASKAELRKGLDQPDTRLDAARCLSAVDPSDPAVSAPLIEWLQGLPLGEISYRRYPIDRLTGRASDEAVRLLASRVADGTTPAGFRSFAAKVLAAKDLTTAVRTVMPVLKDIGGNPRDLFGVSIHDRTAMILVDESWGRATPETRRAWSDALPHLIALLDDKRWELRTFGCEVLAVLGPEARSAEPALVKLVEAAKAAKTPVPHAAALALVRWSPEPPNRVDDLASCVDSLFGEEDEISQTLRALGEPAVPTLAGWLRDRKHGENPRSTVMNLLGSMGPRARAATPVLIEVTRQKDDPLNLLAAHALGLIGPEAREAVPTLIELAQGPETGLMSGVATESLGRLGEAASAAVPILIKRLGTERPGLKWRAVVALGRIGKAAEPAVPALTALLDDDRMRYWALDALGAIAPDGAAVRDAAARLGHDRDPYVQSLARKLSGPRSSDPPGERSKTNRAARISWLTLPQTPLADSSRHSTALSKVNGFPSSLLEQSSRFARWVGEEVA